MEYKNNGKGALFIAREKKTETSPDYNGSIEVNGTEYWVNGWKRVSEKGTKYLSLAVGDIKAQVVAPVEGEDDDEF